jgi:GH24 family phage-related lysozyme (muramidase)
MTTSANGLNFIMENEGFQPTVKGDAGGKQVVGYGHDLLPGESFPDGVTQLQAYGLLLSDTAKWDAAINRLVWTLTQDQHDALSDFTHECGIGALNQLAAHGQDQVTAQLPRWVHALENGIEVVLPGMVARRQKEIRLFQS